MNRSMRSIGLLILLSLSSACSFDFESQSQVTDRRILSIQANPPQLTNRQPLTSSIQIDALVAEPGDPSIPVSYSWWYCVTAPISESDIGNGGGPGGEIQDDIRCPQDSKTLIESGKKSMESLSTSFAVPNDILAYLSTAGDTPAPRFDIEFHVDSNSGKLVAVKNIAITPNLPIDQGINANPQLAGLQLDGIDWQNGSPLNVRYGECTEENRETKINSDAYNCLREVNPVFDADEAQFYEDENLLSGENEPQRERLQFSWFVDSGDYTDARTLQPDPRFDFPYNEGVASQWREPDLKPENTNVTVWLVVRDGRGGISWQKRKLLIQ